MVGRCQTSLPIGNFPGPAVAASSRGASRVVHVSRHRTAVTFIHVARWTVDGMTGCRSEAPTADRMPGRTGEVQGLLFRIKKRKNLKTF